MHKIGGINRIGLLIKEEGINWNKEEKKKPAKFKPKWKWLKKTDKAFQSLCLFRMQEKPKTKPYNIRSKGRETFENMAFVSFWLNALKGCRNFHCHMIIASFFLSPPPSSFFPPSIFLCTSDFIHRWKAAAFFFSLKKIIIFHVILIWLIVVIAFVCNKCLFTFSVNIF